MNGVPLDVLFEALDKAKAARGVVLDAMESGARLVMPPVANIAHVHVRVFVCVRALFGSDA